MSLTSVTPTPQTPTTPSKPQLHETWKGFQLCRGGRWRRTCRRVPFRVHPGHAAAVMENSCSFHSGTSLPPNLGTWPRNVSFQLHDQAGVYVAFPSFPADRPFLLYFPAYFPVFEGLLLFGIRIFLDQIVAPETAPIRPGLAKCMRSRDLPPFRKPVPERPETGRLGTKGLIHQ